LVEQAHLGLTPAASRFPFAARLSLDAALNDGWLRANTLELYALRSHAAVTGTAVRWSDVLTGRTGRLLGELTAGRTVLQRLREHRAQL